MKNIALIVAILLSSFCKGQTKEYYKVNVMPVKSEITKLYCDTIKQNKSAVVIEFNVLHEKDIEKFGNKIYAIFLCRDYPYEMFGDDGYERTLEFSEIKKYYSWDEEILNEELLEKNKGKKKYWMHEFYILMRIKCGHPQIFTKNEIYYKGLFYFNIENGKLLNGIVQYSNFISDYDMEFENGTFKKKTVYYNRKEKIVSIEVYYYINDTHKEKKIHYSRDHKKMRIVYFDQLGNKTLKEIIEGGKVIYSRSYSKKK